jgi:aryl-alcohol dehydrogenase-like predicted oxidoreductase
MGMYAFNDEFSRAAQAAFDAHTALASLAAMTAASNEFLAIQHPQDLLQMATDQGKHAIDRAQAYGREATEVALNKPLFR